MEDGYVKRKDVEFVFFFALLYSVRMIKEVLDE